MAPTPRLRYWRTQRTLLERELAEKAGVDLTSVQRGERNQPLQLGTIRPLAEALAARPDRLMSQQSDRAGWGQIRSLGDHDPQVRIASLPWRKPCKPAIVGLYVSS
ncbi:MAG TPA: helix-turn-helix domain-containing protein [Chloroflexota bacterium]